MAGGAALVLARVVERETRDLDFFGATAQDVDELVAAVDAALHAEGLGVQIERRHHGFARLTVSDGTDATEVDLGFDARIRPTESSSLGPTLALEELAADKMLALFGRAQPRDFTDVAALVERFDFERLCELAAEKDPGFSRAALCDMLRVFDRYTPADLGVDELARQRLTRAVQAWRQYLAAGERRPPEPRGPGLEL